MNKKIKVISFAIILTLAINLFNINSYKIFAEENSITYLSGNFISEDNYSTEMDNEVVPYLDKIVQTGYIQGENEQELYYEKYIVPEAKATIVISHGFTEYTGKFKELIYYFLKNNYSVYILEHRGHGHSGSLGKEDDTEINVDSYDSYVSDFKTFLDEIVIPNQKEDQKLFLYAHSMGGCIGTMFLEKYPEYFNAAILSSPMLTINTGSYPHFVAEAIAAVMNFVGQGDDYVFGQGKYDSKLDVNSSGTSSEQRYSYIKNRLNNEDSYAQRGGGSFQWLREGFISTEEAVDEENASKVEIPVLLFQAENDSLVEPEGQDEFQKYAKNCTLERIMDSKHEIYRENDEILKGYLDKVFDFYQSNL